MITTATTLDHLTFAQLDSLYDFLSAIQDKFHEPYEGHEDYTSGVCHTLRMLGLFADGDIERWGETPIPLARQQMIDTALSMVQEALS
jgi:hypothetical protein